MNVSTDPCVPDYYVTRDGDRFALYCSRRTSGEPLCTGTLDAVLAELRRKQQVASAGGLTLRAERFAALVSQLERLTAPEAPARIIDERLAEAVATVRAAMRRRAELLGQATVSPADQAEIDALTEALDGLPLGSTLAELKAWDVVQRFANAIKDGSVRVVKESPEEMS